MKDKYSAGFPVPINALRELHSQVHLRSSSTAESRGSGLFPDVYVLAGLLLTALPCSNKSIEALLTAGLL